MTRYEHDQAPAGPFAVSGRKGVTAFSRGSREQPMEETPMIGITSYGAYIPWHRLDRQQFVKAWGGFAIPGERSVAYYDEDSVTMAVEASQDCLGTIDPASVDGLYFATTTSPFREKQCSALLALPLDLRREIRAADFNTSLKSGSTALLLAADTVRAGSAASLLVCMADKRIGGISGFQEQSIGDGAAAFLVGNRNVIAEIQGSCSISEELSGTWRGQDDVFVRFCEDRMAQDVGYFPTLTQAIDAAMKKLGLEPGAFAKVVMDCPGDPRGHGKLLASLGFGPQQVQDPLNLFMNVGFCGCAGAPLLLVSALEEARPGDRILFAGSGNGADVIVMQVTDAVKALEPKRGVRKHQASKHGMGNYNDYLRWRDLVPLEAARRPDRQHCKVSANWREQKVLLGLYGVKCRECGCVQYDNGANTTTPIRVCASCQAQDRFEDYRFARKRGKVFSFTHDSLAQVADPPSSVVLVDFDGGGRAFFDLTDRDPETLRIGTEVEMTFRRVHVDRGMVTYFWKARPARFETGLPGQGGT
jgi:hydroxymethylglutaryl-CoA synthase